MSVEYVMGWTCFIVLILAIINEVWLTYSDRNKKA